MRTSKSIVELNKYFNEIRRYDPTEAEVAETIELRRDRIAHLRSDYNAFVQYYFPHYCTRRDSDELIPCADFHINAANDLLSHPNGKFVFMWARGHAKSTHMDIFIPMWLKCQEHRQMNVMVLVGKSQDAAIGLLKDLQDELATNRRYIDDYGEQVRDGSWQDGNFITNDDCAFFALGRGQSPRGLRYHNHRPDYIVVDDLDDDQLCTNDYLVGKVTDWVREALFGCFGGGGGRFAMVGNLISRTSVLANIAKVDTVHVSKVNVVNDAGEPSWPAMWRMDKILENEQFMGYRSFQKEFMNNPITQGCVFKNNWIKYCKILPLTQYAELILYVDPSFKPATKNDYKAAKLWAKTINGELHHIKAFVRQTTIMELVFWMYDTYEWITNQGAIVRCYMEANFIQDMILDVFRAEGERRGYQLPIIADKRKKPDKFQRIEAISPLWERGYVWYNEDEKNTPDFLSALDQTLAFEKGTTSHDDAPDADEGAIYLLQQRSRAMAFKPMVETRPRHHNHSSY